MDNNRLVHLLVQKDQIDDSFSDSNTTVEVLPSPIQTCCSYKKIIIAVACTFVLVLVVILGFQNFYKHETINDNTYSEASSYTYNANGNLDLRIHTENISCEQPSCLLCKIEVDAHRPKPLEPKRCKQSAKEPYVINGTCYLCGNACKNYNDIRDIGNIQCGTDKREITCCVKASMCSLDKLCNGGDCHCYQDNSSPLCVCPLGKKGLHCEETDKEDLLCSCLATAYKFSNEENILSCNVTSSTWTSCHMPLYTQNKNYNCLCQKKVEDISETPSCYSPHQDMLTNGAYKNNLLVSIANMAGLFIVIPFLHRDSWT